MVDHRQSRNEEGHTGTGIPDFLKDVLMAKSAKDEYLDALVNWAVTEPYIREYPEPKLRMMECLLYLETTARKPRQGMLDKLLSRYHTAHRQHIQSQISDFVEQTHVIKIGMKGRRTNED